MVQLRSAMLLPIRIAWQWFALHRAVAKGRSGLPAGVCAFARQPLAGRQQHFTGLPCGLVAAIGTCLVTSVVLGALHGTLQPEKVLFLLGLLRYNAFLSPGCCVSG